VKKNQDNLMQYVEKKFMEIDYNMLIHNQVHYIILSKKITLWGGGAMVKNLTPQCEGEEFKSPYL
jgi:hypothetical protein